MNEFNVKSDYKYLGEVPEFREKGLPVGYLIDKGKVGCGGTTIALKDDKDTIVCVPFVSLIKNKMHQFNKDGKVNILGVYEGITVDTIKRYAAEKSGAKKIVCTYDSLPKVIEAVGYNYNLLVDELHLLFTQYAFREKAVKGVLDNFRRFKSWSFLTATPIEYDLMLDELKDIPTYKINWANKTEIAVRTVKCKQIKATVKKVIDEFLEGKVFGNCHLFVNSVDFIAKMIKYCNLTPDNTRIIFSKNNPNYKNTCSGIKNGDTTDEVKKINFYTSTCFEGCDLFDRDGKIYIISDSSAPHTLADISTSIRQIAGRIRDTQYHSITHIYTSTRYNENLTYDEYKQVVLKEEASAKSWVNKVNNDDELREGTTASKFAYVYKDDEVFKFNPNLMKLDIFNFKCLHHTYSLSANLSDEYSKVGIQSVSTTDNTSDKLLKDDRTRTTFKDAITEYDEIIRRKEGATFNFSFNDDERIALLKSKYPYIDDAYRLLGMDEIAKMNYHTTNIQRYVIANAPKLDNLAKVAKLLKTVSGFSVGEFITGKKIKEVLGNIYNTLGMSCKPSIDDFREFATIKEATKRVNGKVTKGYIIQFIKVR